MVFADSNKVARGTLDLERSNWKGVNLPHQEERKEERVVSRIGRFGPSVDFNFGRGVFMGDDNK